jgi:hypothetical protein
MLVGASKSISGFDPRSIPGCALWLDGADTATMNSTPTVTTWTDKSGQGNNVTGTATYSSGTMTFNGTNQAFSNTAYVFPSNAYSMFAVYSNTTAPASAAYMNVVYGNGGYPMLGVYGSSKFVSARSVVANTGALSPNIVASNVLVSATYTPSTFSPFINGSAETTLAGTTLAATGIYVGGPTNYFNGSVSEILIYSATLTQTQRQSVEGYLAWKWGLQVQVPAPVQSPRSISGCALWLDAADTSTLTLSTNNVTQWSDKSGNGNNATQATTSNQPTTGGSQNGLNTLLFTGKMMTYPTISLSAQTVFCVYLNTTFTPYGWPVHIGPFAFFYAAPSSNVGIGRSGYTDEVLANWSTNGLTTSKYTVYGGTVSVSGSTTSVLYFNGNQVASNTVTSSGGLVNYTIGTLQSGANTVTGYIAEVIVFNSVLGTAQRQSVENYLMGKWGIKPSLPATHPFYSLPAFSRPFGPLDIPGCALWLDGADASTMNSTTTVTSWTDKSGLGNTMTGTATFSGSNMTFNGSTQAFSNTAFVFPSNAYSMFAVYSNTTAPAAAAYMNAVYGNGGYPMLGTYDTGKLVSARSVVGNAGGLGQTATATSNGWAAQIAGSVNDVGFGVATDSTGNVFVTGQYQSALTLYNTGGGTGTTLTVTGGYDAFLAKYSSAGSVVWATRIAGTGTSNEIGFGVATDSSGNVFVTGQYQTALTLYNTGGGTGATLAFTGGSDVFLAKYSSAGSVVWATRIAGSTNDGGQGVATDSSDNVFVTGYYTAALTLYNTGGGTGATLAFTGSVAVFLAKYSSAGSVVWATRITGTTGSSSDYGNAVATDLSGNVFVTGYYSGVLTLYNTGGGTGATLTWTSLDCFLAKYSSAGSVVWATRIASGDINVGQGVATDSSGNVFVTGYYGAALTLYNTGGGTGTTLTVTGGYDVFLAKYSSAGSVVWATRIAGTTTSGDISTALATDSSGNVFVTGYYGAALTLYNTGGGTGATLAYIGGNDAFLAKYSSAGSVLWATRIAGTTTGNDQGYGLATDSSGNVFVTGQYQTALTLYDTGGSTSTTLANAGGNDVFLAKYSSTGFITGTTTTITGSGYPASSNVLVDGTYTPSSFSPYINGSNVTALSGTTAAATGLFIGGPSNYFNGSLSELLIYSQTLTNSQRQQVEGYLTSKWNLGSQIISTHPFKTLPPSTSQPPQFQEVTPGNWKYDWQPYLSNLTAANSGATASIGTSITPSVKCGFAATLAPNGNLYSYGWDVTGITVVNTTTNTIVTTITGTTTFAYFSSCLGPDGNVYCPPYTAATVCVIYPATNTFSTSAITMLSTPNSTSPNGSYCGSVLGPNGKIYCIPRAYAISCSIGIIDTVAKTFNIMSNAVVTANQGYIGGVLAPNGKIYCIPFVDSGSVSVGIIDPATDTFTTMPSSSVSTVGAYNGGVLAPNGKIYCIPYNATNVGIIDPVANTFNTTTITNAPGSSAYTGGCLGPNGKIYFAPRSATAFGVVDPVANTLTTTGGVSGTSGTGYTGAFLTSAGKFYCPNVNTAVVNVVNFSSLNQTPSPNYCLSTYTNKS